MPPEYEVATNWPVENANINATREGQDSSIGTDNVSSLGVGWTFTVDINAPYGALTSNPVVAGDTIYLQDAKSNVYALDKTSGEQMWANEYDSDVPSGGPNGIAIAYGHAFFTLGGPGEVRAVDAGSGEEVWRTTILGPLNEGITMAPMVYDSVVYVSTIPGTPEEFYQGGQRGVIHALDASDGHVLWYFDTTTENLWGNARVNSGGGLWHPPSIDENGNLYVGVGNAAPYPGTDDFPGASSRPGPNDYADSLLRIDPETASVDWYINIKPHDLFDHDNQLSPILANVSIGGNDVPIAVSAGKHGYVVAAERETGRELWRTAVGDHNENEFLEELGADEQVDLLPGFIGGVETPMAYREGVIYAPVLNIPFTTSGVEGEPKSGSLFDGKGALVALDAATGEILWNVDIPTMVLGGATVVNDVVFTGGLDGLVRGFDVADGSQVFTYQASAGINSSFAVSGDTLYVPAGAPLTPSDDTADPAPEMKTELIALAVGAGGGATPTS